MADLPDYPSPGALELVQPSLAADTSDKVQTMIDKVVNWMVDHPGDRYFFEPVMSTLIWKKSLLSKDGKEAQVESVRPTGD